MTLGNQDKSLKVLSVIKMWSCLLKIGIKVALKLTYHHQQRPLLVVVLLRPDVLYLQVTTPTDLSDLAAAHQPAGGKKSLVFTCSLEGKCCWQCQGLHEDPFNRSIRCFVSVTFSVQTASMSSVSLHLELKCSFGPRRPRAPSTRANEQVIRHQMFF